MEGNSEKPTKEGPLRKKGVRLLRWSSRYFTLAGRKLSYKLKNDAPTVRDAFDLDAGCMVTDITEESNTSMRGAKKVYSFWVLWPHDKNQKTEENSKNAVDSDDEEEESKEKDLKSIIHNEAKVQRDKVKFIEQEIVNHKAHDSNIKLAAKVAAVTAGGVIVGALTAGIGMIPYFAVVGGAAVAGGGALAFQMTNKPADNRLILGADSLEEAKAWKQAIEAEIAILNGSSKPTIKSIEDATVVSAIIDMSVGNMNRSDECTWRLMGIQEGMRLLENTLPPRGFRCCKAQLVVDCSPLSVFCSVMEDKHWPRNGKFKVDRVQDDHADVVFLTIHTACRSDKPMKYPTREIKKDIWTNVKESIAAKKEVISTRSLALSRFWKLDDDGLYLITLNTMKASLENKGFSGPSIDAVITISPRKDHIEYDDGLPSALVSCTCQVSYEGGWKDGEMDNFIRDFLHQQLLDLKCNLQLQKSGWNRDLSYAQGYKEKDVYPSRKLSSDDSDTMRLRRPITSQPGVDDFSPPASPMLSHSKSFIQLKRTNTNSKIGLKLPTPEESLPPQGGAGGAIGEASPNRMRMPRSFTRVGARKSVVVNPEASRLKQDIASKEYSLERVEKQLKSSKENSDLLKTQMAMITEIAQLKERYEKIAGMPYENRNRNRFRLMRWRSNVSATDNSNPGTGNLTSSPIPENSKSNDAKDKYVSLSYPRHWIQPSTDVMRVESRSQASTENFKNMLFVLCTFSISFLLSLTLRDVFMAFIERVL